jgi:predicted AlkP superfamily pyrophosphatase or phosphodiesterase
MAVDEWGHMKGADSAEYANAVAAVGHLIAARMPEWLQTGYQVVVTADHGMNNLGIHVGTEPAQREVALYIFSDKVENGRFEENYISQLNVAPMVCRLLGIPAAEGMKQELEIQLNK